MERNLWRSWLTVAILATACSDGVVPSAPPPHAEIVDGTHSGGNPAFHFLAPIVKDAAWSGIFDPTHEPVVIVCETDLVQCLGLPVAEFTTTTGPASETVRVVVADEHYIVNWHTDLFNLDPSVTYRIVIGVDGVELGHADLDVVSNGNELKNVNTNEYVALKDGRTLPIKFRIEEGALPARFNWFDLSLAGPGNRFDPGYAFDESRGIVVLYGGIDLDGLIASPDEPLDDTWEFDGSNWSVQSPSTVPPRRADPGFAYDSAREIVVMFGGSRESGSRDDTWEYTSGSWTEIAPIVHPGRRTQAGMDYDRVGQRTVLYGGNDLNTVTVLGDLWSYNGTTWTLVDGSPDPGPRTDHLFVYDRVNEVFVLQGGLDNAGPPRNILGDTWIFDGTNWILQGTARSLRRYDHAGGWSEVLQAVVMVGGQTPDSNATGTWYFRDGDWHLLETDSMPSARRAAVFAGDPVAGVDWLFGGLTGGGLSGVDHGDTWQLRRTN